MELAKQVTSLEISKELERLHFVENCMYLWVDIANEGDPKIIDEARAMDERRNWYNKYGAYTASELMEYLPAFYNGYYLEITKDEDTYYSLYIMDQDVIGNTEGENTLADSLGNLLIYLLSNNLIDGNNKH